MIRALKLNYLNSTYDFEKIYIKNLTKGESTVPVFFASIYVLLVRHQVQHMIDTKVSVAYFPRKKSCTQRNKNFNYFFSPLLVCIMLRYI